MPALLTIVGLLWLAVRYWPTTILLFLVAACCIQENRYGTTETDEPALIKTDVEEGQRPPQSDETR